jgi:hypothetical protein
MVISSHTLTVKHRPLQEHAEKWRALYFRCHHASPFISYDWYASLSEYIIRYEPMVLSFWHENHAVGMFAVRCDGGILRAIQDDRVTDNIDILIEPGFENEVINALAAYIIEHDLHVDIAPIEPTSVLARQLPLVLDGCSVTDHDICPYCMLPDTWDEYLAGLKGKHRHELRRKMKRAEALELRRASPDKIGIFFDLMSCSALDKASFLTDDIRSFITRIATAFARDNRLRLQYAWLDNTPVAALLSFIQRDRVYLYNSGYDPSFTYLSPGIVAIALDIKQAIDDQMKSYDFLRGKEPYKLRFSPLLRSTKRLQR